MKTTLSDFGQDLQMPTIGQTYDIANQYKPSTGEVAGAFIEDAFQGVGSASYIKTFAKKEYAEATQSPLTKEAFEQSEYNIDGVDYYDGMTQDSLKILHDHEIEQQGREFIMSRASSGQLAAGFVAGLGSGIFEPANVGLSVATAGIGSSVGFFKNMVKGASSVRKAVLVGAAESTAQSAIMAPVNIAMSKRMQDDYGALDIFLDWSIGTTLGAGIDAGVTKVQTMRSNKMYNQISNASQKYGLDPNVMALISGYESSSVTKPNMKAYNKDTGAFGPFQFLPSTAKDYGIDRKSSYEDQLDAYMRFTKDNAAYVEKRIKRPLAGHEVYMAHWMGRGGAAAALKADPSEKAINVFKKNGLYKGYESKVLRQNRFDKDVTIAGLIKGSKDRLNHHAKSINPNYTPASADEIDMIDAAIQQANDQGYVDLKPLFAQQAQKTAAKGEKFLKKIDEKIDKEIESFYGKLEKNIESDAPTEDLDLPEISRISKDIENKIFDQLYKYADQDKSLTSQTAGLQLKKESYQGDSSLFFEKEILSNLLKEINDDSKNLRTTAAKIKNYDFDARLEEELELQKTPHLILEGMEENLAKEIEAKEEGRKDLKGKRLRQFDSQSDEKISAAKKALKEFKSLNIGADVSDARIKVKQELTALKSEHSRNIKKIKKKIAISKEGIEDLKRKSTKLFRDSVLNRMDPLSNPVYDVQSIKQADEIADEIANSSDVVQANIDKYTADIAAYKEQGLIDAEMQEALDNIDRITIEDYNAIYKEAETCLLTFGGK